jgi:hypothetical protein
MWRIGFAIGCAAVLATVGAPTAHAQSLSGEAAVKNAGNTADDFSDGLITSYQNKTTVAVVSSTTTMFRVRYQEIVAADVGVGCTSSQTQTQNSDYSINFTATAPGAYRLHVSTSVKGAFTTVDDGDSGAVDMTAVTGSQSGGTLESGSNLSLNDPGSVSSTASTDVGFALSSSAIIDGTSNGVGKSHSMRFTWSASATSGCSFFSGGDEAALRMGLPATFGNQTAGTYPGPDNRPQGPDGHWVTVSLESLCGNGTIDSSFGEQCDEGANNGLSTSCCTSTCQLRAGGQVCRPAAGVCDIQETCTGSAGACPADGFHAAGFTCRAAAGVCDVAESCTGTSANCPADGFLNGSTVCRSSAGGCDVAETCPGNSASCPADTKRPSGFVCRAAAGACDVA